MTIADEVDLFRELLTLYDLDQFSLAVPIRNRLLDAGVEVIFRRKPRGNRAEPTERSGLAKSATPIYEDGPEVASPTSGPVTLPSANGE